MNFDILTLVRRVVGRLPSPEVVGFGGYVSSVGFDPIVPNVPCNHPNIVNNNIYFQ